MERIILLETSTALCSAALAEDGVISCYMESDTPRSHASLTAVFIDRILKERDLKVSDCDAVCVSMGPGSYTGLRVGVSTAKGLCFGAGIPLIAVGTPAVLAAQAIRDKLVPDGCRHIIPMIDARRMEVYSAVFTSDGRQVTDTKAEIVDENSYSGLLEEGDVLFIGDGAGKCSQIIHSPMAHFVQCCPKAESMLVPAMEEFRNGNFRDTAYFEPFYLKDFVATTSRKKLF